MHAQNQTAAATAYMQHAAYWRKGLIGYGVQIATLAKETGVDLVDAFVLCTTSINNKRIRCAAIIYSTANQDAALRTNNTRQSTVLNHKEGPLTTSDTDDAQQR